MAETRPLADSYFRRLIKVVGVCHLMGQHSSEAIYAETNHMFLKVFHDVVIDAFPDTKVILLRRNMAETLKSMVDLGYFSEASWHWRLWMQSTNSVTAVIQPYCSFADLDPVDKAIAYLIDIEGRASRFRRDYPDVPIVETSLESISDEQGAVELLHNLGLEVEENRLRSVLNRTNARDDLKGSGNQRISVDECVDRIRGYVARMNDKDSRMIASLLRGTLL